MCLLPESHEHYCQLARNLEDEKLLELDAHYRQNSRSSVDWELHGIVIPTWSLEEVVIQLKRLP